MSTTQAIRLVKVAQLPESYTAIQVGPLHAPRTEWVGVECKRCGWTALRETRGQADRAISAHVLERHDPRMRRADGL